MVGSQPEFVCHPGLVDTPEKLQAVVAVLEKATEIAIDTEFIRESTFYPVLEIIQVATSHESWLIDYPALMDADKDPWDGFVGVLENPGILKIMHASQGDQECLLVGLDTLAKPMVDTAVAAALLGLGDQLGLGAILKSVLDVKLKKGHARTHWGVRPLPDQLQEYAHLDVRYLVKCLDRMRKNLERQNRWQWALDLSAVWCNPETFEQDPEKISVQLARGARMEDRGYRVVRELVLWRERRVRELNVPRRRVADDSTLIDLAQASPKDVAHLKAFRGLSNREMNDRPGGIIEAVRAGLNPENTRMMPPRKGREPASDRENSMIALVKCFLVLMAEKNRIASRLLLGGDEILDIVRARDDAVAVWVENGLLSPQSAELMGEPLKALVTGKTGLGIRQGALEVFECP